jgi:hypothetical protein
MKNKNLIYGLLDSHDTILQADATIQHHMSDNYDFVRGVSRVGDATAVTAGS